MLSNQRCSNCLDTLALRNLPEKHIIVYHCELRKSPSIFYFSLLSVSYFYNQLRIQKDCREKILPSNARRKSAASSKVSAMANKFFFLFSKRQLQLKIIPNIKKCIEFVIESNGKVDLNLKSNEFIFRSTACSEALRCI